MSEYMIGILSSIGINSILALSVYVILASGQLSLGNAGFMAVGAYFSSFLTVELGVPFNLSLIAVAGLALLIGLAVGIPVLRFQGIYLAMTTLAVGEVIRTFFMNFEPTGATQGYSGMDGIGVWDIWIWAILLFTLVYFLMKTTAWLKFSAVETDNFAAEITGLNTTYIKTASFALGAVIAAIGGGLFAQYRFYIEPNNFGWTTSIDMVLFVIIGGSTVIFGPLAGAAILTVLPELLRPIAEWRLAVYGALLVLILLLRPEGIFAKIKKSGTGNRHLSKFLSGLSFKKQEVGK